MVVVVVGFGRVVGGVAGEGGAVVGQLVMGHASQQLVWVPAQACPPFGALHAPALRLTPHFRAPFAVTRQQVTKPDLPQVEFAAHRLTAAAQGLGSAPALTAPLTTWAAHCTYPR